MFKWPWETQNNNQATCPAPSQVQQQYYYDPSHQAQLAAAQAQSASSGALTNYNNGIYNSIHWTTATGMYYQNQKAIELLIGLYLVKNGAIDTTINRAKIVSALNNFSAHQDILIMKKVMNAVAELISVNAL